MRSPDFDSDRFRELGYLGPIPLFSIERCREFLRAADDPAIPAPLDWQKARAITSPAYYQIAADPALLQYLSALLGPDLILWGADLVDRSPGDVHPWHSDIESSHPDARTVSVWIGLENASVDSSLKVISRSHQFGLVLQQVRRENNKSRDETTDDDVAQWAAQRDAQSELVTPPVSDGQAIFFDGRLWHGSRNTGFRRRRAVLLQYATPDTPIRIPDFSQLDWPFKSLDQPRPPCILVAGQNRSDQNRIVLPPADPPAGPQLTGNIHPVRVPLPLRGNADWQPNFYFHGISPNLPGVSCHASALRPGHSPHPPHRHQEEELLLLLAGQADLTLPDLPTESGGPTLRLTAGQFVYYPRYFAHTLHARGETTANYLMFKWHRRPAPASAPASPSPVLPFARFDTAVAASSAAPAFHPRLIFEGPTTWLSKFHCHLSTVAPNAGYAPHADPHDVALVMLQGEIETLGRRAAPHDVVFHPAGQAHGLKNIGPAPARYLVFEFHGPQPTRPHEPPAPAQQVTTPLNPTQPRGLKRLWPFAHRA